VTEINSSDQRISIIKAFLIKLQNDDGSEIYNKAFYPYKNYFQTNDFEDDPIRELYKRLQLEMEKNKSKKDYKRIQRSNQ
jgi:hypothetical protein